MEYNGRTSKSRNSLSDKKNLTQRRPLTKVARQLASSVTESPFRPRKTPIKVARQLASLVEKPPFHRGVTTVHYRQPVSEENGSTVIIQLTVQLERSTGNSKPKSLGLAIGFLVEEQGLLEVRVEYNRKRVKVTTHLPTRKI